MSNSQQPTAPAEHGAPTSSQPSSQRVADTFGRLLGTRLSPQGRPYKLSEISRATGLPRAYLAELRRGTIAMPSLDRAVALADFFGVDVRFFLGAAHERQTDAREHARGGTRGGNGGGRRKERDRWYRLTVRLDEEQYGPLDAAARRWGVSPNELLRSITSTIVRDLDTLAPAFRAQREDGRRDHLVTVGAVLQALAEVYERQIEAYRSAAEMVPHEEPVQALHDAAAGLRDAVSGLSEGERIEDR